MIHSIYTVMMLRVYLLFFCIWGILVKAQDPVRFDSIYTHTYLEIAQKDFNKALNIADSLYLASETPYFQTKSLMLTATLYQQSGDLNQSIAKALEAEKRIINTTNYVWISRVYGFLATQYRLTGLSQQSKKYREMAYESAKKIEGENRYSTLTLLLQEMAFIEMDEKNYKQAIQYLNQSQAYLDHVKQNKASLIAQNDQLLGDCYFHLKEYDKAIAYYQSGRKNYGDLPDNYVKGLIFDGIAYSYLKKGEFKTAESYLDSAKNISEISNYLELKKRILNTSQELYLAIKDIENVSITRQKQDSISQQLDNKKLTLIEGIFDNINTENSTIKKEVNFKNKIIFITVLLFLMAFGYFLYYRRKQQKNIRQIKEILHKLENKNIVSKELNINGLHSSSEPVIENQETENNTESSIIMNSETEEKLVQKLEQFETTTLFTQKSISLSSLAIFCKTNPKYLSYIINTYKKQDFYNYINELRINYIIHQLNEDPMYRKYKIATLAEEAGFSSQNKFATVFKKVTSISPSTFIKYLEEEKSQVNI